MKPVDILEHINGSEDLCEICGESVVTLRVQGETDSFGHEDIFMCHHCYEHLLDSMEAARKERIANGEIAPDGQVWLLIAGASDDYDWDYAYSRNKGEVENELENIEARYARHGGVYNPSIKLVPEAEAKAVAQRHQHRWDDEEDNLYDEEEEEDPWDLLYPLSEEEKEGLRQEWEDDWPDYEEETLMDQWREDVKNGVLR